jgi:hypothetical protein
MFKNKIENTRLSVLGRSSFMLAMFILSTNTGCTVSNRNFTENNHKVCTVSDSMVQQMVQQKGATGVQFVNKCNACVAVAFEYHDHDKSSKWSACYVPSHSRVVFREANEYWLVTQKPCNEAKKHGLGGIASAEIENNALSGRCDSVSVVND